MQNTIYITLIALLISALAMRHLRNTDTKRRRAHRLPDNNQPRYTRLALCISLLPGLVLLWLDNAAPFIMWLAAFSLLGWFVALPKPK